jgi:hypothetical protein
MDNCDDLEMDMMSYRHDADLEDWTSAFKTILMHQTFCEDSIKELFADEY